MKKAIFAIILVLVFITAGVLEQLYVKNTLNKIESLSDEVRELAKEKDFDSGHAKAVELCEYWRSKKHLAEALISHNETKDLTLRLAELEGYIAANDDKSAIATAAIISEQCSNLRHILAFSWDTIL